MVGGIFASRERDSLWTLAGLYVRSALSEGPIRAWRRARGFVTDVGGAAAHEPPAEDAHKFCLFVAGCRGATRRYRCDHAAEALRALGYTSDVVPYPGAGLRRLVGRYQLIVLQRVPHGPELARCVAAARAAGVPVLFDIDDLLIDESLVDELSHLELESVYERWLAVRHIRKLVRTLRLCDAVLTSTPVLAERLRERFPDIPVTVVPNVASREQVALAEEAVDGVQGSDGTTIGYFSGSPTHAADLQRVVGPLAEVLSTHPQVRLLLVGAVDVPSELASLGARIERVPLVPMPEFYRRLRSADIHLAPLVPTAFNEAKSAIKWVESALVGRPLVATDLGALRGEIRHRETGYLCRTEAQWSEALHTLVGNPGVRERVGSAARREVLARCTTAGIGEPLVRALQPRVAAPRRATVVGSGVEAEATAQRCRAAGLEVVCSTASIEEPCDIAVLVPPPAQVGGLHRARRVLEASADFSAAVTGEHR